jgi:hypothetical protein
MADTKSARALFKDWRRKQAEQRELEDYQWSLREAQELENAVPNNAEAAARFKALQPFIEASNKRGDFKRLDQMTSAEVAEHCGFDGGTVFLSEGDIRKIYAAVGADDAKKAHTPIAAAWRAEWAAAKKEGRFFVGVDFEGDNEARLTEYMTTMENAVRIKGELSQAIAQAAQYQKDGVDENDRWNLIHRTATKHIDEIKASYGKPFSVFDSAEVRQFDRMVKDAGGVRGWDLEPPTVEGKPTAETVSRFERYKRAGITKMETAEEFAAWEQAYYGPGGENEQRTIREYNERKEREAEAARSKD